MITLGQTWPDVMLVPLWSIDGRIRAYAIVDEVDADLVMPYRWSLGGTGYAVHTVYGTNHSIYMHREILGLFDGDDGRQVDHKNRNRLDNRRSNLRVVTLAQNLQNRNVRLGTSSSYRGVHWDTGSQRWRCSVTVDGKVCWRGSFLSEEEAHRAVTAARRLYMPYSMD